MEGEATPTRSAPLPVEEKDEETEETREEEEGTLWWTGQGGVRSSHAHHITLNFYLKY